MDFWNAFFFKNFYLSSNEVINIQKWELIDDQASSSLQGPTYIRGEFIREICAFESFYHYKYNYRDQNEMQRRIVKVKAKLLWEYKLSTYATYLQTYASLPEETDIDMHAPTLIGHLKFP